MAKELIISSNRHETKVAMFEDEQLVEIYFQRADEYSLAGSIHKGRVTRVLPGMQSAFVNIGLERDAFLYVSDFFEESEEEFDKTPITNRDRQKARVPQLVDEDTGEPTNESNERFATAQTVAELAVGEPARIPDEEEVEGEEPETDAEEDEAQPESDLAPPAESRQIVRAADSGDGGFDDRRGRRRRRRRGRGGSGLPESKFAEGAPPSGAGRFEGRPDNRPAQRQGGNRPARGPVDEDARWNRKPVTKPAGDFEDEDPPQAVLIAKVSDPNRLPPPRRHDDSLPLVLPGESLAKYRRGSGEPGKSTPDFDAGESAGSRYSQPRRNRHGRAGFLAPADDLSSESAGKRDDQPAEGRSASLFPPDDSNPKLAVKAPGPDSGSGEASESLTGDGAETKTSAKKKATKKAPKATKTAARKATRKRASKAQEADNAADDASTESAPPLLAAADESPEEPAALAVVDPVDVADEDAADTIPAAEALAGADNPNLALDVDEGGDATAALAPGDEPEADDFADDESDLAVSADGDVEGAETPRGADSPQRLSRRERRRLRMIERRDERRKTRDGQPLDAAAPAETVPAAASNPLAAEPAPARPGRPEPSARPERSDRPERGDRSDRSDRGERGDRSDRGERGDRSERSDRGERGDRTERSDRSDRRGKFSQPTPSISEVLKEGQEVLVQIAKEPLGQKGARITSHIALPGRYVVYMPTVEHVGVSRKVGTDNERIRLRKILQTVREGMQGGFICRTAAEGRTEAEIRADMEFLYNMWLGIKAKADKSKAPALIHHDLDIVERMLRDQLTDEFKTIWVDNEELYERILRFVQTVQPSLVSRVRLYTKPAPIFDTFNVTSELEKALRPKVWLKSGGYIVINQTEALVAIDVNTGKFVGKSNRLEDTIVKTNLEAVKEAVRQIRLRDLGGIIVVDFIDMDERKNRYKVMQALDEAMKEDRAPYKILQFNDFGLIAITRKRVKQSLERTLCQPCPTCEGAGYIKNVQTIIGEILTEATKLARAIDDPEVSLRVHPEVGKVLKSHTNKYLEELEEILKVPVIVTSDPLLHPEKFDLA